MDQVGSVEWLVAPKERLFFASLERSCRERGDRELCTPADAISVAE